MLMRQEKKPQKNKHQVQWNVQSQTTQVQISSYSSQF